ncbi:MAG: hypothetical protein ACRDPK_02945 [Carbonactinosporaceae bacterium]
MVTSAMASSARSERRTGRKVAAAAGWALLRLATAAMLAVDAWVHIDSAANYDADRGGMISQGDLFRVETAAAGVVALAVLVPWAQSRWLRAVSWVAALLVAGSALGAVLLYRYVDVGVLGPLPDMYEPTWQVPGKLLSACAEAAAVVLALIGLLLESLRARA